MPPTLLAAASHPTRVYTAAFSPNGTHLAFGTQSFAVHISPCPTTTPSNLPTSSPLPLTPRKTLHLPRGAWSITDTAISPDSSTIALATLRSHITLGPLAGPETTTTDIATGPTWLNPLGRPGRAHLASYRIWALAFLHGARASQLVAGLSSQAFIVVDLAGGERTDGSMVVRRVEGAHGGEVNAVGVVRAGPDVVLTGGDDAVVRVWDLRERLQEDCGVGRARGQGVFRGHRAGVVSVDVTGDGRGAVSVGKDQCVKVWDLRRMSPEGSVAEQEKIDFDYRVETCPIEYLTDSLDGKDDDDAVMTLRDEMKVYRSFARARYWHADEKYIAVGGATADLRIWNVQSGELVQKVTIDKGDEASGQQQQEEYVDGHLLEQSWVVRDVSWHPTQPIVAAGSWWSGGNGKLGRSTVHDFRGCLSRDEELGDNDWVKVD